MTDIEKHGNSFLVKIGRTKTKISRSFTINGGFDVVVQKYMDLRSQRLRASDRFFTNYQRGKNKFSKMSNRIANYLQLEEPERYTGMHE